MIKMILLLSWLAGAAPSTVRVKSLKDWGMRLVVDCGAELSDRMDFDQRQGTVYFGGKRLIFDRVFGGYQLLFAMLKQPGEPVPVRNLLGRIKSAHFENFKTLNRVFRELDPSFDGFRVKPGEGFYYQPGPYQTQSYAPITWSGMTLDWLAGTLTRADGRVHALNVQTGELLRLIFLNEGRPISFDDYFAAAFPGRDPIEKPTAFKTLGNELPGWLARVGLTVTADPVTRVLTLVGAP